MKYYVVKLGIGVVLFTLLSFFILFISLFSNNIFGSTETTYIVNAIITLAVVIIGSAYYIVDNFNKEE
jgi:hypothetical protein